MWPKINAEFAPSALLNSDGLGEMQEVDSAVPNQLEFKIFEVFEIDKRQFEEVASGGKDMPLKRVARNRRDEQASCMKAEEMSKRVT